MKVRSTYRLQFRNGMGFAGARQIVPYLKTLGISHLYASPVMTAVSGSTHGYDITHANEIDPTLGGLEGLRQLADALHAEGLGLILDIVPNHMAAHLENPWWYSVVAWGVQSPFARHFDIDWSEALTLPFLGTSFEEALAEGAIGLALDPGNHRPALRYYETFYPLHPDSYGHLLTDAPEPAGTSLRAAAASLRPDDEAANRHILTTLFAPPDSVAALEEWLVSISRDHRRLAAIHEAQPWRLVDWRTAGEHLTYRRFFEIAGLVGLRVEDGSVFEDSHRLILDLVREGIADGLRIDHIDGLADPAAYLKRLRAAVGAETFIVAEKIMEGNEALPADWPIAGTTGYEVMAAFADALVDGAGYERLQQAFAALKPEAGRRSYAAEREASKRQMLVENFAGEVAAVTTIAKTIADAGRLDFDRETLREAIRAFVAALPVYRTYATASGVCETDRRLVERVREEAAHAVGDGEIRRAIDFMADLMTGDPAAESAAPQAEFRRRLQQLSGPIMAKAVEDTLFYRENALIALNEVGGDPGLPIAGIAAFHAAMAQRATTMPEGLTATATHDTKRGEDSRARLYALSEAPEMWIAATKRWQALNAPMRRTFAGRVVPEPVVEWLLYQSLAGLWPSGAQDEPETLKKLGERMALYTTKALREAKQATTWTAPKAEYEQAVGDFAAGLLTQQTFLRDFDETLKPFIDAGLANSLSQTLVKLTAPGIPDIYQGSECGDFSLVDPDNRALLAVPAAAVPARPEPRPENFSRYKQWLIATVLAERRDPFATPFDWPYVPLDTGECFLAFLRGTRKAFAITIVPRLTFSKLRPGTLLIQDAILGDATIRLPAAVAGRTVRLVLDGQTMELGQNLAVADLLSDNPVALLRSEDG
jgi:(1->4)-alpha-D-glucan 1-alpha-D-glucosylmutase